jgi:Na+-translocating ferredoxin:NAD+ oxidoreductase RnfD subunit
MSRRLAARRFFRTPKGLLLLILVMLVALAAPHEGIRVVAPGLLSATMGAGAIDALILRYRRGRWEFPDGAVLTALLVAMVLSAQGPWYYAPVSAVLGVLAKYVFRSRAANVFNPAALGIVATFYVFGTGQSWWGALPELAPITQLLMVATGLFIVGRVNKLPLVLAFLGSYFLLFTIIAFTGNPAGVAEIYRTPDLQAALFFAFFILSDPPTSPVKHGDQIVYGVIVGTVSVAVFAWIGAVYYLLAGVLVGNVWEAWRRVHRRSRHGFPRGIGQFMREISPWRLRANRQLAGGGL